MVHARLLSAFCGFLAFCSLAVPRAYADNETFSSTFTSDNQLLVIPVTTTSTQDYTFYTTSYAGGINADGTTTMAGGFDPLLSLYDSNGNLFNNAATFGGSDASFSEVLNPGSYSLVLSEFPNFSQDGTINGYAGIGDIVMQACGTSAAFTDSATIPCTQDTGNYTVNVVSSSVTPEPPSALLVLLPLGGLVYLNRRKLSQTSAL